MIAENEVFENWFGREGVEGRGSVMTEELSNQLVGEDYVRWC